MGKTMADDARIATEVLEAVGGPENVSSVLHCMTRLRFYLKDDSKKDDEKVKGIKGVLGAQMKSGQYQVIIGTNVPEVYDEIVKAGANAGGSVDEDLTAEDTPKEKLTLKVVGNNILDYISGSVVPLIPVIITGALFKTLAAVFGPTMLNVFADDSQFIFLCNMVYNAAFYFMPVLAGAAAAKKLGMNSFLAAIMGVILYTPATGFLVPLSYIGAAGPMNEVKGVIAMAVGALVSFVISWFYSLTPEQRAGTDAQSVEMEKELAD